MIEFAAHVADYWPVYEAIHKYYPINISRHESINFPPMSSSFPGRKAFGDLLDDNIFNGENFKNRWVSFTELIQERTQKKTFQTTHPQSASFTAFIEIEMYTTGDVIRNKSLHVFVSLLGPFYTVMGYDKTALLPEKIFQSELERWMYVLYHNFSALHYVAVSPEKEFAEAFTTICQMVEERFSGYRFVPFYMNRQIVEGLEVPYSNKKTNSVHDALFWPTNFSLDNSFLPIVGNGSFKAEIWIRPDYVDNGGKWYAFPPDWSEERRNEAIRNQEE